MIPFFFVIIYHSGGRWIFSTYTHTRIKYPPRETEIAIQQQHILVHVRWHGNDKKSARLTQMHTCAYTRHTYDIVCMAVIVTIDVRPSSSFFTASLFFFLAVLLQFLFVFFFSASLRCQRIYQTLKVRSNVLAAQTTGSAAQLAFPINGYIILRFGKF